MAHMGEDNAFEAGSGAWWGEQYDPSALVSIVVCARNATRHIAACVDSLLAQTHANLELIAVDRGSTDETFSKARTYALADKRVTAVREEGAGRGRACTIGLDACKGDFVLFLDAEDQLVDTAIETALARCQRDGSDFAVFSFQDLKGGKRAFTHTADYFGRDVLEGAEQVTALLDTAECCPFAALYRISFLRENGARFAENDSCEGDVSCEDDAFYTKAVLQARKVSVIHAPLYKMRERPQVAADAGRTASRQGDTFLQAVRVEPAANAPERGAGKRESKEVPLLSAIVKNVRRFRDAVLPSKAGERGSALTRKQMLAAGENALAVTSAQVHDGRQTVLFMGFDYRYTGNSRYLFESLLSRDDIDARILFATENPLVDDEHRVAPRSDQMRAVMAKAKVVVFESWISNRYKKRRGQFWIQLWHGVPVKRMLYDTSEPRVFAKNHANKNARYADIARWSYLLAESQLSAELFRRAFLLPASKMVVARYPRVSWLMRHRDDEELKACVRREHGLDAARKIVLYLPTWRDYNYDLPAQDYDLAYLMDCARLQELLGEGYQVVLKDHPYRHVDAVGGATVIDPSAETQELLAVADFVVTDYSSVMFDAFAARIPVMLYVADYQKYCETRGVYEGLWQALAPLRCDALEDVAAAVTASGLLEANERIRAEFADDTALEYGLEVLIRGILNKNSTSPKTIYALSAEDARQSAADVLAHAPEGPNGKSAAIVLPDEMAGAELEALRALADSCRVPIMADFGDAAVVQAAKDFDALRVIFCEREAATRLKLSLTALGAEAFVIHQTG